MRLPSVIVPVLSSNRVCTSPAASTARPLMASTLRCTNRSIPAMPMADSSAPIVVGIKAHQQRDQDYDRHRGAGVLPEGLQDNHHRQEHDGEDGEQDR